MISYVEVLQLNNNKTLLNPFAVVEPSECWFELSYYDIGQCEIYAPANANNLNALQIGNFVRIPNKNFIWIITSIQYEFNSSGARMIDAKGYEAKWLLKSRIILTPYNLPSTLQQAVFDLINICLGITAQAIRQIRVANVVMPTFNIPFVDEDDNPITIQATRGELWAFVSDLLKTYQCGFISTYNNGKINLQAFKGNNKTNSIVFSQSMDNLVTATYYENSENKKTYCQVVSTATQNNVTTESVAVYDEGATGIDRFEMLITPNISTKPENGTETTFGSDTYKEWQKNAGQNELAKQITVIDFNGEIDLQNSNYIFNNDFFIGDLVAIRDEYFGYQATARISKYTLKQDSVGYSEEADYGNE